MIINNNLFIHIPKTGGTSMEFFLGESYGYTSEYIRRCIYNLEPDNTLELGLDRQHRSIDYYNNILSDIKFIFTIIRNPYTRLISAYSFYKSYIEDQQKNLSIIEWFISNKINNKKDVITYNNHLLPQHWYINQNNNIYIAKYETLYDDIKYIKQKLNLSKQIIFPHKFKTLQYKAIFEDIIPILSEINEYYKKDFKIFNYEIVQ